MLAEAPVKATEATTATVQLLEVPAPGIYDQEQRTLDPWAWTATLAKRARTADPTDPVPWPTLTTALEADDRGRLVELLTPELRQYLYGARGAHTAPELMALGLADQANKIRGLLPSVPDPAVHLAEALRAYGDFLALRHPHGQQEPVPTITAHHPFDDMDDPKAPAPATGITLPELLQGRIAPPPSPPDPDDALALRVRQMTRFARQEWGLVGGFGAAAAGIGAALWMAFGGRP